MSISFVYLDEFGHIGPYMSRTAKRFNESPVFGLAGIILHEATVRPFATKFLQLKQHVFKAEIKNSGVQASHWEKKGIEIFTAKKLARYPHFRSTGFRVLNYVRGVGGKVFYYGREKIAGRTDLNAAGLYTTVLGHTLRQLENYSVASKCNFVVVVDEHSARKQLLVTALKTMYDADNPARHLISPPFEVESYINQNIQAADWVAAIVGRLWAHQLRPKEFQDHAKFKGYFWDRIHQVATHSTVLPR